MDPDNILCALMLEDENSDDELDELHEFGANLIEDTDNLLKGIKTIMKGTPKESRNCITLYVENVVSKFSDVEFTRHFRIKTSLFNALSTEFGRSDGYSKLREDKRMSPEKHMLLFLWFAGHEAVSFRDLADRFDVSLSTVSIALTRVIYFVSNLSAKVIKWPNEEEKRETMDYFQILGFPNILGAIDGTHIQIDPPGRQKDSFINRKGYTSIQLQAVANHSKQFIDIFVGFPGSAHDSRIFKHSALYSTMREKCGDCFILGVSAYPLMVNLLTPYRDNGRLTERQKNFNKKLSSCRVTIEPTFGILKQRFRQLYYCKLRGIRKLNHFIRACCVLHNLSDEEELIFMEPLPDVGGNDDIEPVESGERSASLARIKRDEICLQLNR